MRNMMMNILIKVDEDHMPNPSVLLFYARVRPCKSKMKKYKLIIIRNYSMWDIDDIIIKYGKMT